MSLPLMKVEIVRAALKHLPRRAAVKRLNINTLRDVGVQQPSWVEGAGDSLDTIRSYQLLLFSLRDFLPPLARLISSSLSADASRSLRSRRTTPESSQA